MIWTSRFIILTHKSNKIRVVDFDGLKSGHGDETICVGGRKTEESNLPVLCLVLSSPWWSGRKDELMRYTTHTANY